MRFFCDRTDRRSFLATGTAAVGASLNLSLADMLRGEEKTGVSKSLIFIFLEGGLSTIDTFDLKPDAPSEFRGEFQPIATNVPGIEIGDQLPNLARQMDAATLVRSFGHHNSDHGPANHYILTGYFPVAGFNPTLKPNNQRPSIGSIISRSLGPRGPVPPYVCLPKLENSAGSSYLGSSASPFVVEADPNAPNFSVPDLQPPMVVGAERLGARRKLIETVDRYREKTEVAANKGAKALSTFQQKAFDLMTSAEARAAFDIGQENPKLRDEYGRTSLGQSCLMARRLVEAGVRCVTIDHTNWDTHNDNFKVLRQELLPQLDSGLATLIRDLKERGLLDSTLIVVTGEFGRTPRINKDAGRDHWGPSSTVFLAGGGIRGGEVFGKSSERAEKPASDPVGPADLAAAIYYALGIDPQEEFYTPEGRPVKISDGSAILRPLFGPQTPLAKTG